MAGLTEAQKIYLTPEGRMVLTRQDGDIYSYVNPHPQIGSGSVPDCDFRYGVDLFQTGSLVCTLAHGLSFTPSLVMLQAMSSSGSVAADGADGTYIRARLSATLSADQSFAWFAGT